MDIKRKTAKEMMDAQREQSNWSEAELGPWAMSKVRLSFNVLTATPSAPIDWPATIRAITCPALLITADPESGAIVNGEQAATVQQLLPHVQVQHIASAGHNIRREQFAKYMDTLQQFLASLA